VDLRVAGVAESGAALVGAPDRGRVAGLRVRREVEDVPVPAGGEHHGIAETARDLARHHVAHDDPARASVHDDDVLHLVAREHLHLAEADLALEGLVGAEQELLARLASGVERARDLRAAEGAVREEARRTLARRERLEPRTGR
jgi:hypothetical protein